MDDTISPSSSHEQSQQHIRLACQACQRKKVKCDRTFPCGQCTRSNLQCVASQRKPRTRHAGRRAVDSELRSRITKLESLVESLSGEVGIEDDGAPDGEREEEQPSLAAASTTSPAVRKYIGNQFWSSLTTEVQALRDALEEDQHEDSTDPGSTPATSSGGADVTAHEYDLLICPPSAVYVMPGALAEPTVEVAAALYNAFIENVTPILRIFHVPTLRRFLFDDAPYLGVDAHAPPCRALKAVCWFAAASTLSDLDCQARFGQRKLDLVQHYRRCVDVRLSQADLMNTTEMTTMHAFLAYLITARVTDVSRRVWTLTATLVRIARAMNLHDEVQGKTPFETEMRRRLWHQVRFIDVFASMDRGTPALVDGDTSKTPLPSNVNDDEFDETSTVIPHHEMGVTDMSFGLLTFDACSTTQRLNTPERGVNADTWQQRIQCAEDFRKRIEENILQYCDASVPFHRLLHGCGSVITTGMVLRAARPLQRHLSSTPRVDSPYVLKTAVDALRSNEEMGQDAEVEKWQWMVWVQWQPLAVALAGLCSIRGTALADEAWPYVERAYNKWWRSVADARNGMLWRPIEKLYKKATTFRDSGRSAPQQPPPHQQQNSEPQDPPLTHPTTQPPQQDFASSAPPLDPLLTMNMPNPNGTDFGDISDAMAGIDFHSSDWIDWEHIMDDLSEMPSMLTVNMGDLAQQQQPSLDLNGGEWTDGRVVS